MSVRRPLRVCLCFCFMGAVITYSSRVVCCLLFFGGMLCVYPVVLKILTVKTRRSTTGCRCFSGVETAAFLSAAGAVLGCVCADGHGLPEPGMVVYALKPRALVPSGPFLLQLSPHLSRISVEKRLVCLQGRRQHLGIDRSRAKPVTRRSIFPPCFSLGH